MDLATCTPDVIQMRDIGLTEAQRHSIVDRPSDIYPNSHAPHIQCSCGQSICGVGSGNSKPELGAAPLDSIIQPPSEKALPNDMFGVMAPCWQLLERSKAHMDKVNIALGASICEKCCRHAKSSRFDPDDPFSVEDAQNQINSLFLALLVEYNSRLPVTITHEPTGPTCIHEGTHPHTSQEANEQGPGNCSYALES